LELALVNRGDDRFRQVEGARAGELCEKCEAFDGLRTGRFLRCSRANTPLIGLISKPDERAPSRVHLLRQKPLHQPARADRGDHERARQHHVFSEARRISSHCGPILRTRLAGAAI
jgi:hypothetical protein